MGVLILSTFQSYCICFCFSSFTHFTYYSSLKCNILAIWYWHKTWILIWKCGSNITLWRTHHLNMSCDLPVLWFTNKNVLTLWVHLSVIKFIFTPTVQKKKKLVTRLSLPQPCSTCFACLQASRRHSCMQGKKKKVSVMGSPSGEVCLDNISITTSTGPVWVIFKWEKRRQGEKKSHNKGLRANGWRNSLQVSACKMLALHETDAALPAHTLFTPTEIGVNLSSNAMLSRRFKVLWICGNHNLYLSYTFNKYYIFVDFVTRVAFLDLIAPTL